MTSDEKYRIIGKVVSDLATNKTLPTCLKKAEQMAEERVADLERQRRELGV